MTGQDNPTEKVSKLKLYSYGIVAANKELNSRSIEVTPTEDLPMLNGEITDNATKKTATGTDASGASYSTSSSSSATVQALWLPVGESSRMTAPDVRRGEPVVLYRFADDDSKFFWATISADLKFRKLETVVWGFSATSDEGQAPSEDNTYIIEMSTHKKYYRIHTSEANDEVTGWDMLMDGGNGIYSIADTDGNKIWINTQDRHVRMENSAGTFLELLDKVINMSADDKIYSKTKDWVLDAETITTNAQTVKHTATTTEFDTSTTHNGNIALNGDITGSPGGGGSGMATFNGGVHIVKQLIVEGGADIRDTLHANHLVADTPVDAPK